MKHIERFRKMITMALEMEWIERDPFVKFKPKYIKTDRENLSEDELQRIGALSSPSEHLTLTRDLFVFSCYSGIAFSNILLLTKESISPGEDRKPWIVINPKMSLNPVEVPLLPKAIEIIVKYKNSIAAEINQSLFPKISNAKMNSCLKEIAHLCKIQKLSFAMGRETFATTVALTHGVPIETLIKLFGYSKIASSKIYEKAWEKKIGEEMGRLSIRLKLLKELKKQKN